MTPAVPQQSQEDIVQHGQEIYQRHVKPKLTAEDDGKYVVIDVGTEEFEVGHNEWDAIELLSTRHQGSQLWITRIGQPYRMSFRMRFGQ